LAWAYQLIWVWDEHLKACELTGAKPANQIVFLIDEVEAHLHPRWQLSDMKSILEVMDTLLETQGLPGETPVILVS